MTFAFGHGTIKADNSRRTLNAEINMNKYEFLRACEEYTDGKPYINDDNFIVVEYVYNWHPAISETRGKDQIAMLYCTFGMCVIYDMYPRAKKMQILDDELKEAKAKVEEIENKIKDAINAEIFKK